MSTHNICIRREIRKILCGYPLLPVAMAYLSKPICTGILFIEVSPKFTALRFLYKFYVQE